MLLIVQIRLNDVKGNVNTACFSLFLRARRWDVIRCNLYDTQSLQFQHAYSSYYKLRPFLLHAA